MSNNLHISYDLNAPNQNYEKVITAIKGLGGWAKIHKSFWYVNSTYTASQACAIVWAAMDSNDTVYVIDATNNAASWQNINPEVATYIRDRWLK
ncbi:MAG: hypothetical protein PGN12_16600 [Sphingomonas phyllosphaerae]